MADNGNVLGAPREAPTMYWICKECPVPEECSEKNFRSWQCWDEDLESCKRRVMDHLIGSGHHKERRFQGEDRNAFYTARVEDAVYEELPVHRPTPGRTKRKHPSAPSVLIALPSSRDDAGGDRDAADDERRVVQRVVSNTLSRERTAALWHGTSTGTAHLEAPVHVMAPRAPQPYTEKTQITMPLFEL